MRTLAVTQNITVDGAVEMIGDWFTPGDATDEELLEETRRQDERADAVLLGRETFTAFRGFWPHQSDDRTGITDYLNRVEKFVVSSTLTTPDWANTTILSGDPVQEVAALKARPGRDIVLTGSITLCHTLIAAGLVDEYRLFTYPVVQGRGRRLFPDGCAVPGLRLLEARSFGCGVTFSSYAPA